MKKNKTTYYNGGIIRLTEYGTYRAEINATDMSEDGKRQRQTFKNELQAKEWIEATQIAAMNSVQSLGPLDYRDAVNLRSMIPAEYSLAEVGRFFLDRHTTKRITLEDSVLEYFTAKENDGLREISIKGIKHHVLRLSKNLGARIVSEIRLTDIQEVIKSEGIGLRSIKNYKRDWGALFNWGKTMGYCTENPTTALKVPKEDSLDPSTVTPEQADLILRNAVSMRPEFVPYFTLGLFCGIRPNELTILEADCMTREEGHVFVGSAKAKTRENRFVTIPDNAKAWLDQYPIQDKVCGCPLRGVQKIVSIISKAAGMDSWPRDVMRHSFASYHLALWRDAAKTAHELGHRRDQQMLWKHYRALVTYEAAVQYFGIIPEAQNAQNLPS